ncbi:Glycosyl transferase, family 31 [Corchorus olitorius]|uniref:Glycosyl transferase, family 31 n=1 Tax=Corchorus olitorius TaxID=93759 RepID=A0A1R3J7F6_9ROSI|nr:Glycosyl transferase, family 31 [Corchorus olitorius]
MASPVKAFVAVLILGLVTEGLCACSLNDINIGTVRTGREIQGKSEWNVTVINNCKCTQSKIKLTCQGFQSVEAVDQNIFLKQGDNCLLIKGDSLPGFRSVGFSYAWDPPFVMFPSDSVVETC